MIYTLSEIQAIVTPVAVQYGLRAVYVFGSYANGTAREDSDVDLIVDTTGTDLTNLFKLGALYSDLEEALNKKIDLLTLSSLEGPCRRESDVYFRSQVNRERKNIYVA